MIKLKPLLEKLDYRKIGGKNQINTNVIFDITFEDI